MDCYAVLAAAEAFGAKREVIRLILAILGNFWGSKSQKKSKKMQKVHKKNSKDLNKLKIVKNSENWGKKLGKKRYIYIYIYIYYNILLVLPFEQISI